MSTVLSNMLFHTYYKSTNFQSEIDRTESSHWYRPETEWGRPWSYARWRDSLCVCRQTGFLWASPGVWSAWVRTGRSPRSPQLKSTSRLWPQTTRNPETKNTYEILALMIQGPERLWIHWLVSWPILCQSGLLVKTGCSLYLRIHTSCLLATFYRLRPPIGILTHTRHLWSESFSFV